MCPLRFTTRRIIPRGIIPRKIIPSQIIPSQLSLKTLNPMILRKDRYSQVILSLGQIILRHLILPPGKRQLILFFIISNLFEFSLKNPKK